MTRGSARYWLLLPLAITSTGALADGPAMAREGAASYFCGGVGAGERREMKALAGQANLELLFVTEKRGGYLAGVALEVADGKGAKVLQTVSDGPLCMLTLPAGRYTVRASFDGTARSAQVRVAAGGTGHRVALAFPGEKWDGIWASDEEKKSARAR